MLLLALIFSLLLWMITGQFSAVSLRKKPWFDIVYCTNANKRISKTPQFLYENKTLPVVFMLSRPFTQDNQQMNQLKHQKLTWQLQFSTLTSEHQTKPVP